ncbi:uncharacterized protein LOC125502161 [Athalia rosae]|uniref:uncharacterized protein LOC125502161 n=1 Tax=Athalia rosae TaxID=37344 RepID=UPI0020345957|nr:uncharacterized protein LOC125502161 [Athalia rosae]
MASGRSGLSREGCSKLFRTFEIALKKSDRHLLLSSTYGLNASWSKKLTVGLRLRMNGTFESVVRLINNYSSGVSLGLEGLASLIANLPKLEEYFVKKDAPGDNLFALVNDTIALDGGCSLRFTTAHGAKVIAFYSTETSGNGDDATIENSPQEDDDEEDTATQGAKRRKVYTPVIVMQKVTFDGLKHIACCANERLLQLDALLGDVNRSKESVVRYFASIITARKIKAPTLQQIHGAVCDDIETAREVVCMQFDIGFRDYFFDIVYCEMMRLFLLYIVADIRQSVLIQG